MLNRKKPIDGDLVESFKDCVNKPCSIELSFAEWKTIYWAAMDSSKCTNEVRALLERFYSKLIESNPDFSEVSQQIDEWANSDRRSC